MLLPREVPPLHEPALGPGGLGYIDARETSGPLDTAIRPSVSSAYTEHAAPLFPREKLPPGFEPSNGPGGHDFTNYSSLGIGPRSPSFFRNLDKLIKEIGTQGFKPKSRKSRVEERAPVPSPRCCTKKTNIFCTGNPWMNHLLGLSSSTKCGWESQGLKMARDGSELCRTVSACPHPDPGDPRCSPIAVSGLMAPPTVCHAVTALPPSSPGIVDGQCAACGPVLLTLAILLALFCALFGAGMVTVARMRKARDEKLYRQPYARVGKWWRYEDLGSGKGGEVEE